MDSGDKIAVEVGPDKAAATISGEGASRISGSLADFLSPFAETAGALGDAIRAYRTENAIRALARAKALSQDHRINLQPVAPKFLLQWTEAASLEEPGDDDLCELWAHLLISSSKDGVQPAHYLFKRILNEINRRHVGLLQWLCDWDEDSQRMGLQDLGSVSRVLNKLNNSNAEHEFLSTLEDEVLIPFIEKRNSAGIKIVSFKVSKSDGKFWLADECMMDWRTHNSAQSYFKDHSFEYLKISGIIKDRAARVGFYMVEEGKRNAYLLELNTWHLTNLGLSFLQACFRFN